MSKLIQTALLLLCQVLAIATVVATCFSSATHGRLNGVNMQGLGTFPILILLVVVTPINVIATRYLPVTSWVSWALIAFNAFPLALSAYCYGVVAHIEPPIEDPFKYKEGVLSGTQFYLMLILLLSCNILLQLLFKVIRSFDPYAPLFSLLTGDLDFQPTRTAADRSQFGQHFSDHSPLLTNPSSSNHVPLDVATTSDDTRRVGDAQGTGNTQTIQLSPSECTPGIHLLPIWIMRILSFVIALAAPFMMLVTMFTGWGGFEKPYPPHVRTAFDFIIYFCMFPNTSLLGAMAISAITNSFRLSSRRRLLITGLCLGFMYLITTVILWAIARHRAETTEDLNISQSTHNWLWLGFSLVLAWMLASTWTLAYKKAFRHSFFCWTCTPLESVDEPQRGDLEWS